jgi:hypothetical protein
MANGISNLGGGAAPFWGDGSDGVLSAGATYQAGVDFDEESGFCIKQFTSIDWDPATPETLTVDKPCRGLILFSQGPVYIGQNATISMAKKGSIVPVNPECLIEMFGASAQMRHIVEVLKTLRGGAGGDGGRGASSTGGTAGAAGTGGPGRICQGGLGGGGSGSSYQGGTSGAGGTIILPEILGHGGKGEGEDGWQGGGGAANSTASNDNWRCGGHPYGAGAAGGSPSRPGGDGEPTGGFLLIISQGEIVIDGTIDVTGGDGGSCTGSIAGGGGGGSGGGVIALFAQTSVDVSSATVLKDGGQGGSGAHNGTGGQQGTLYTEALAS